MFEQEDRYWWFVARRRLALQLLRRHVPNGCSLLDVGCGTGAGLGAFSSECRTFGADFSELALGFCAERGISRLVQADAQALPVVTSSFDAVISLDTIEHIPDDCAAVSEIYRILKPGGTFIMNVPAYKWLWGPHDVALMHHRRYTRSQVKKMLVDEGFEVKWSSYSVFFLFPFVVLARLKDRFFHTKPEAKLPKVSPELNKFLTGLHAFEASLALNVGLPWGSSITAVATKPKG